MKTSNTSTNKEKKQATERKRVIKSEIPQKPIDSTIGNIEVEKIKKTDNYDRLSVEELYRYYSFCEKVIKDFGDRIMIAPINEQKAIQNEIDKFKNLKNKFFDKIYRKMTKFLEEIDGEKTN